MKNMLVILFFFMIQICKSTEFETFEKKRKLIADHIQGEISRGESPYAFSTDIFGNWPYVLYKCNQIASCNKGYKFELENCLDFFTQLSKHRSLENKSNAEALKAIQEFKNLFTEKIQKY